MKTSAYIFPSLLSLGLCHMSLYSSPPQSLAPLPPRYVSSSARGDSPTPTLSGSKHRYYFLHSGALTISLGQRSVSHLSGALTRALQGTYLERCCVHACTLLCTRGYTKVYTRVYFSLLDRRYISGNPTPGIQTLSL